jgi:hypothetical protein
VVAVFVLAIWLYWFVIFSPHPTRNQEKLKAIKAESELLMATYPATPWPGIPERHRPPVIASLKPEWVMVDRRWGVDIKIKPFMDGGWGYEVPRRGGERPLPEGRCDEVGQGVYWCHPY